MVATDTKRPPQREDWSSWWPEEPADPEHLLTLPELVTVRAKKASTSTRP